MEFLLGFNTLLGCLGGSIDSSGSESASGCTGVSVFAFKGSRGRININNLSSWAVT
jgi:hypothetical protein